MSLVDRMGAPLRTCERAGCSDRGVLYPEVIVPPRGYPIERGVRMSINVVLCKRHAGEERVENFLTDQFRAMAAAQVGRSPIPLDFERAEIRLKTIGGKDWERLQKQAREGRQGRDRRKLN